MRKVLTIVVLLASVICYGQDELPGKPNSGIPLKEGVCVHRAGTRYSSKTYTEIYDVITDSLVSRFGLEFRSADSSFVRRVPMDGITRKLYDQMKSESEFIINNQEQMRRETTEFINRYRTSYEVWLYFRVLGVLGR